MIGRTLSITRTDRMHERTERCTNGPPNLVPEPVEVKRFITNHHRPPAVGRLEQVSEMRNQTTTYVTLCPSASRVGRGNEENFASTII